MIQMKKNIENFFGLFLATAIVVSAVFLIGNPTVKAVESMAAPTSEAGPIIDSVEASNGFSVVIDLSGSGAVAGDELELYVDEGPFNERLVATLTESDIDSLYSFTIESGQFADYGTKLITYVIWHDGVEGAQSQQLILEIRDTISPIGRVVPGFDGYINDQILSFDLSVIYNELVDVDFIPTISFGSTTGVFSVTTNGEWSEGEDESGNLYSIWTQSFEMTDGNELVENVSVHSSGAVDLAGNIESASVAGAVNVDTLNPEAVIGISNSFIYKGNLLQTVTVDYGEAMNTDMEPDIYFRDNENEVLDWSEFSTGYWSADNSVYTVTFVYDGVGEVVNNVFAFMNYSSSSSLMEDVNGNVEVASLPSPFFMIDVVHPSGYQVSIDQRLIDNKKTMLSFSYTGAEIGATYHYSIDDEHAQTAAVSGGGLVTATTSQVGDIDVLKLKNGVLTLVFYLTSEMGDSGSSVMSTVLKKVSSGPYGYIPPSKPVKIDDKKNESVNIISNDEKDGVVKNQPSFGDKKVLGVKIINKTPFKRSLLKERIAIGKFGGIYGRLPSSSSDWDKVWMIAYARVKT